MYKSKIINVAYHRNGVAGNGFHVVHFRSGRDNMYGVVFEEKGNVAVFNQKLLSEGVIEAGVNSYRGDDYEAFLRWAVQKYYDKLRAAKDSAESARIRQGGKEVWATV